tara:strand:- start:179 stop:385 length:207 start_codon:yes stop_codon:yes gene_type:complete
MSEECCNFCGEIAENEETVWGYLNYRKKREITEQIDIIHLRLAYIDDERAGLEEDLQMLLKQLEEVSE